MKHVLMKGILIIFKNSVEEMMTLMDDALQRSNNTVVNFVSLFSGGLQQIESRRSKGFPGVVVHGEYSNKTRLGDIMSEFDSIMSKFDYIGTDNDRPTLYEVVNANHETSEYTRVYFIER